MREIAHVEAAEVKVEEMNTIDDLLAVLSAEAGLDIDRFYRAQEAMSIELNGFFNGTILSTSKIPYTPEEKQRILSDLYATIKDELARIHESDALKYVGTAGAPGAGKSFFLESQHETTAGVDGVALPSNAIYVDPDRFALMRVLSEYKQQQTTDPAAAYTKWRDASNFVANFMLVTACAMGRNIAHGTTATSPRMIKIYEGLKGSGYDIEIHVLFASNEQRLAALQHRAQSMVQVAEEDVMGKEAALYPMIPGYLSYANQLTLHRQPENFWLGEGSFEKTAQFEQGKLTFVSSQVPPEDFKLKIQEVVGKAAEEAGEEAHESLTELKALCAVWEEQASRAAELGAASEAALLAQAQAQEQAQKAEAQLQQGSGSPLAAMPSIFEGEGMAAGAPGENAGALAVELEEAVRAEKEAKAEWVKAVAAKAVVDKAQVAVRGVFQAQVQASVLHAYAAEKQQERGAGSPFEKASSDDDKGPSEKATFG